jgi:hypothetical protein
MPRVGFETTTPMFERAKKVHALDRAATVNCPCIMRTREFTAVSSVDVYTERNIKLYYTLSRANTEIFPDVKTS